MARMMHEMDALPGRGAGTTPSTETLESGETTVQGSNRPQDTPQLKKTPKLG